MRITVIPTGKSVQAIGHRAQPKNHGELDDAPRTTARMGLPATPANTMTAKRDQRRRNAAQRHSRRQKSML